MNVNKHSMSVMGVTFQNCFVAVGWHWINHTGIYFAIKKNNKSHKKSIGLQMYSRINKINCELQNFSKFGHPLENYPDVMGWSGLHFWNQQKNVS